MGDLRLGMVEDIGLDSLPSLGSADPLAEAAHREQPFEGADGLPLMPELPDEYRKSG
jgi:hypothetical protein